MRFISQLPLKLFLINLEPPWQCGAGRAWLDTSRLSHCVIHHSMDHQLSPHHRVSSVELTFLRDWLTVPLLDMLTHIKTDCMVIWVSGLMAPGLVGVSWLTNNIGNQCDTSVTPLVQTARQSCWAMLCWLTKSFLSSDFWFTVWSSTFQMK